MKTFTAVVGEKGRVTIPKSLRDVLGITAGTELEFEDENGRLVARRVIRPGAMAALIGAGDPELGRDSDAVLTDMRGPAYNAKIDG